MSTEVQSIEAQEPDSLDFEALLNEVQAKRGDAKSEPEADEPEPVVTQETKSESPKPSWKDFANMELPEDVPHGFYKNQPIEKVFEGIKNAERAMHEANERAKKAEAIAAANEISNKMLLERLEREKQTAPKPTVFEQKNIDLRTDWIAEPEKVKSALDEERRGELAQTREEILKEVDSRLDKDKKQQEEDRIVAELRQVARQSAQKAFDDLKVPEELRQSVLNTVVPILSDKEGSYFQAGGVLEVENYKKAIMSNPLLKAAIQSYVKEEKPEPNPPGAKATSVRPDREDRPSLNISNSQRELWTAQARLAGCETTEEVESFIFQTAEKAKSYRTRRQSRG